MVSPSSRDTKRVLRLGQEMSTRERLTTVACSDASGTNTYTASDRSDGHGAPDARGPEPSRSRFDVTGSAATRIGPWAHGPGTLSCTRIPQRSSRWRRKRERQPDARRTFFASPPRSGTFTATRSAASHQVGNRCIHLHPHRCRGMALPLRRVVLYRAGEGSPAGHVDHLPGDRRNPWSLRALVLTLVACVAPCVSSPCSSTVILSRPTAVAAVRRPS